jgi:hypothetical protein
MMTTPRFRFFDAIFSACALAVLAGLTTSCESGAAGGVDGGALGGLTSQFHLGDDLAVESEMRRIDAEVNTQSKALGERLKVLVAETPQILAFTAEGLAKDPTLLDHGASFSKSFESRVVLIQGRIAIYDDFLVKVARLSKAHPRSRLMGNVRAKAKVIVKLRQEWQDSKRVNDAIRSSAEEVIRLLRSNGGGWSVKNGTEINFSQPGLKTEVEIALQQLKAATEQWAAFNLAHAEFFPKAVQEAHAGQVPAS